MTAEAANWALAWSTVLARPCVEVEGSGSKKAGRTQQRASERVGPDTHVSTVCSSGAVGLLLQMDLLQLLSVHQGQLLLMLLVLFGCESCGRQTLG